MPKAKKIVITGIPGSGTTDFCDRYIGADPDRLRVKTYHMGDLLLQLAQETPKKPPIFAENLLNLHPELLQALTNQVFDITLNAIRRDQDDCDRQLIDMHGQFFWNDVFTNAYDWSYLAELNADLFVTLIEKPSTIRERQMSSAQGRSQNHSIRDISLWQNIEVNTVEGLATNFNKPHVVLPGKQDPLTIECLLNSAYLIYFQMPMTEASTEADAKIAEFKKQLLNLGRRLTGLPTPLIDPRTIDIESGAGLSQQEETIVRRHTVHRDLNWYITEASDLVAFYPKGAKLSKGVSDESTRGFETGKNVYVVYPTNHTSPFMDIATRVFVNDNEFFKFYEGYMPSRIKELRHIA